MDTGCHNSRIIAGLHGWLCGQRLFPTLQASFHATSGMLPGVLLLGVGITCPVAPLTNAVISSVPESATGIASAVNNALSRFTALLAISLLALVLAHGFQVSLNSQIRRSGLPAFVRKQSIANQSHLRDTPVTTGLTAIQRSKTLSLRDRAFLSGFRLVMFTCAGALWIGALGVALLLPGAPQSSSRRRWEQMQ
jgi:hypothetical protein